MRRRRTREEIEADREFERAKPLAFRAKFAMDQIIAENAWDRASMWEASGSLPEDELAQVQCVLGLFNPDDVVWCGDLADSISREDAADPSKAYRLEKVKAARPFRRAEEWLEMCAEGSLPGPRICPKRISPGVLSRSG